MKKYDESATSCERRRKDRTMDVIKAIEAEQIKDGAESFRIGDTVKVHYRIVEGKNERVQVYEGLGDFRQQYGCRSDRHREEDFLRRRAWSVSSPSILREWRNSKSPAGARFAGPSCTICATASVRRPPR
jgi:hypothetical protein